jgi:uncharacterized protein (TIGR02145 family)
MNTVKIGSKEWATEDLKVTKFRNGEDIPLVTDNEEWAKLDAAAYCVTSRGNYLYNWYAVNDIRGLAPEGFYVPTDEEWTELIDFLGGKEIAGEKMKIEEWGGNNQSGFSALPSGYRGSSLGFFCYEGYSGSWWSSSAGGTASAWGRSLYSDVDNVYRYNNYQRYGFSVRCLKTFNTKNK